MNSKKIAFLICTNNEVYLNECIFFLNRLVVPEGYEIDIRSLKGAMSMTSGYNKLASETDAEIKVYLHQDTFIINRYFLSDILDIFSINPSVGLIGMVGYMHCSSIGVMWKNFERVGSPRMYGAENEYSNSNFDNYRYSIDDGVYNVCMADGFLLATNKDVRWDEERFTGWDFYDADQCLNYIEQGYTILVPHQKIPWCIHDDGKYLNLGNYDKYRQVYMKKHRNTIEELSSGGIESEDNNNNAINAIDAAKRYNEINKEINVEIKRIIDEAIKFNTYDRLEDIKALVKREGFILTNETFRIINLLGALEYIKSKVSFAETFERYIICSFMLRRVEIFEDEVSDAVKWILDNGIEPEAVISILKSEIYEHRNEIVQRFVLTGLACLSEGERLLWAMKLGTEYHTDVLCINVASMLMDFNEFAAALNWLRQIEDKTEDINSLITQLEQAGLR